MKVLVCGSRTWVDQATIERELRKLEPGTIIVHGGARGADNIAGLVAQQLGFEVRCYPAQWDKFGRAAGPIRNEAMLKAESPDRALVFTVGDSKGTMHMVSLLEKAGIPYERFKAEKQAEGKSTWCKLTGHE